MTRFRQNPSFFELRFRAGHGSATKPHDSTTVLLSCAPGPFGCASVPTPKKIELLNVSYLERSVQNWEMHVSVKNHENSICQIVKTRSKISHISELVMNHGF